MDYIKNRLKERDSHVVILSALYTVAASIVPLEYRMILDGAAAVVGAVYLGTPIKKLN